MYKFAQNKTDSHFSFLRSGGFPDALIESRAKKGLVSGDWAKGGEWAAICYVGNGTFAACGATPLNNPVCEMRGPLSFGGCRPSTEIILSDNNHQNLL